MKNNRKIVDILLLMVYLYAVLGALVVLHAGKAIGYPWWQYGILIVLLGISILATYKKITKLIGKNEKKEEGKQELVDEPLSVGAKKILKFHYLGIIGMYFLLLFWAEITEAGLRCGSCCMRLASVCCSGDANCWNDCFFKK